MPKRSLLAVATLTLAVATGLLACEDDTIHPLPLDAGAVDIDAAPPPPVDSGADAARDASSADAAPDAAPGSDASASDASRTDGATDASADASTD